MAERPTSSDEWAHVEQRKPKQRACSYCGRPGHTVRECLELQKKQTP